MKLGGLFEGGGGLTMAARMLWPDIELAWYSENDPHASRLLAHHHPGTPNLGDITAIDWTQVEPVDVIAGGFPCVDISHAGRRAGIKEGTRSGLWFRFADAIRVLRPRLVLLENVAAIASPGGGLDVVLGSLAEVGFDAEWGVLRASDVGAPHRRARWFCVAYPSGMGWGSGPGLCEGEPGRIGRARSGDGDEPAADATLDGRAEGRPGPGQRARGTGQPASDRAAAPNPGGAGTGRDAGAVPRTATESGRPRTDIRAAVNGSADAADPAVAGLEGRRPERQRPDERATRPRGLEPANPDSDGLPLVRGGETFGHHADRRDGPRETSPWGIYEPAVRRWEAIIGRPAPPPVDDRGRLNPPLPEWMLGWPESHTALLPRSQALKVIGNGVVPLQAAHAYQQLLARIPQETPCAL